MKRPCVLICSHERVKITRINIESLLKQSVRPVIVLVVSSTEEANQYKARFPEIIVSVFPNDPLGAKWQHGVEVCRKLQDINCLIPLGSDDILRINYIKRVEEYINAGYQFIGLYQWWIWNPENERLYLFDYKAKAELPLGGGRVYSKWLLDKLHWQIFNQSLKHGLDDKGWFLAIHESPAMHKIKDSEQCKMELLAVKGNWKVMNRLEDTLRHPNARLVKEYHGTKAKLILIQKFNYIEI